MTYKSNQDQLAIEMNHTLDIHSRGTYPSNHLSNFYPHSFIIDSIGCGSMEGFLQSLTHDSPSIQEEVCKLSRLGAKNSHNPKWKDSYTLHWKGMRIDRFSNDYQVLLDRAYSLLYEQSKDFRLALMTTGNKNLGHTIGKDDQTETILTNYEFISRLEILRFYFFYGEK